MVLVDDLLMFPIRSVLWIFREIHNAAQEELAREADAITAELTSLYMRLETGNISEEEFAVEEKTLLDRLDSLQKRGRGVESGRGPEKKQDQSEERRAA